jgi:hypothetical protein
MQTARQGGSKASGSRSPCETVLHAGVRIEWPTMCMVLVALAAISSATPPANIMPAVVYSSSAEEIPDDKTSVNYLSDTLL